MSEYKPQFQVLEATVKTGKIIDFQRKGNVVRFFIGLMNATIIGVMIGTTRLTIAMPGKCMTVM